MSLREKFRRAWKARERTAPAPRHEHPSTITTSADSAATVSTSDTGLTASTVDKTTPYDWIPRPLWKEAFESLRADPETSKLLDAYQAFIAEFARTGSVQSAQAVISISSQPTPMIPIDEWRELLVKGAKNATALMAARREHFTVVSKIANVASSAKDALAFLTSFEPHAAMVWTGVSAFLPLLINQADSHDNAVSGLEDVTEMMERYNLQIKTYRLGQLKGDLDSSPEITAQLERHCVALYAKVFEFQLRLACRYARNFILRSVRQATLRDDWKSMLDEVRSHETSARLDMEALNHARIATLIDQSQQILRNQIRQALCCDFSSGRDMNPPIVDGTCEWLPRSSKFRAWRDGTHPFMFMVAGPGCGKSMLMKYLVTVKLPELRWDHCYFFFSASGPAGYTISKALCAIVYQLYTNHSGFMSMFKHALAIQTVERWWRKAGPTIAYDVKILWSILTEVADKYYEATVCVLDAIDQALSDGLDLFMRAVNHYYADSRGTPNLRLIITARPYFDRAHGFKILIKNLKPSLYSIGSENFDHDTSLFIHSRAAELDISHTARNHLVDLLLKSQKESRTFLWVRLIFHYLEREPQYENAGPPQIDRLVKSLPKELDQMYEDMLKKPNNRKLARMVFHILMGAREPLQVSTLRTLLRFSSETFDSPEWGISQSDEIFERILGNLCSLLVMVTDSKVHFIHQTVNDFLLDERSVHDRPRDNLVLSFRRSFHPIDYNLLLSELCSSYLVHPDFNFECDPYVARHWLSHHRYGLYTLYHHPGPTDHPKIDSWPPTLTSIGPLDDFLARLEFSGVGKSRLLWHTHEGLSSAGRCDVASDSFWKWYTKSGFSSEQLRHEWYVWLILLLSETRCALVSGRLREVLALDEQSVPRLTCSGPSDSQHCPVALEFDCSSLENFKHLYKRYCQGDFESWHNAETGKAGSKKQTLSDLSSEQQAERVRQTSKRQGKYIEQSGFSAGGTTADLPDRHRQQRSSNPSLVSDTSSMMHHRVVESPEHERIPGAVPSGFPRRGAFTTSGTASQHQASIARAETVLYAGKVVTRVRALFDSDPSYTKPGELHFEANDVITVLGLADKGRWIGALRDQIGSFDPFRTEVLHYEEAAGEEFPA